MRLHEIGLYARDPKASRAFYHDTLGPELHHHEPGLSVFDGGWFEVHDASRICVDVEPDNHDARGFYTSHGATYLNSHWLVWSDLRDL